MLLWQISRIRIAPRIVERLTRYLIAFVFLYSGGIHEANPTSFLRSVQNYQLEQFISSYFVAEALPKLEILVGIFFLVDMWIEIFYPVSIGLFALFSGVLAVALARGHSFDCGCFGSDSFPISWWHVVANLAVGILASYGWWYRTRNRCSDDN